MVSMKGSFVKAVGWPSHLISAPATGFPVKGLSSFRVISAVSVLCWFGSGTATRISLERHSGTPLITLPFNPFTCWSFMSAKDLSPSGPASMPLIPIQRASSGYFSWNSFTCWSFADMKDQQVKGLKGKVMSGVPECRSKEILVAVPEPNQQSTLTAEITLKLDKPLTGKPVAGAEI